jgi:hypothetical protein
MVTALCLLLVGLLLSVCLSLSLFLEVEHAAGYRQMENLQLRQHARLALRLAAGTLQAHLGPDLRASARADSQAYPSRWIGAWKTDAPETAARWLVSSRQPDPAESVPAPAFEFCPGYDHDSDGNYNGPRDVPPARAPWQHLNGSLEIAWWIEDLGLRAPLTYTGGIEDALLNGATLPYLDYPTPTLELAQSQQDPIFDCPDLFDCSAPKPTAKEWLQAAQDFYELECAFGQLDTPPSAAVWNRLHATRSLRNAFVLSNPITGDLKRDLSFIKALDPESLTHSELQKLYPEPEGLINTEIAKWIQTVRPRDSRANPLNYGIRPPLGGSPSYSLAPILTEFRFSAGLAADRDSASGDLYLVHKCYLELWNPYTIPLRVGDPTWPAELGYSNLNLKIKNLPHVTLQNKETGHSVSLALPDLSFRWSDYAPAKILRPGMVFHKSLPEDAAGTGTRRTNLSLQFPSHADDSIEARYQFGKDPVRICLYAMSELEQEACLFAAEIKNYPDFQIHYLKGGKNRHAWFQRKRDSPDAKYGMNNESLEVPGYAFTLRFKVLDRNRADWQRFLTEYDFRKQTTEVDLANWDPAKAWEMEPPLPYDFRTNARDCHPANFDHAEFFAAHDLFHYENALGSVGRRDRILRACDAPTAEKFNPANLQTLQFFPPEIHPADYFFYSTLPDPIKAEWDGRQPLLNSRLKPLNPQQTPRLESPTTAKRFLLHNGFNLNSTDFASWVAVLSGQSFPSETLRLQYEKGTSPSKPPSWFRPQAPLQQIHFNYPQSAVYGLTEQTKDPAYTFINRNETEKYPAVFTTSATSWRNQRQHPALIQNLREFSHSEIEALAHAVIHELKKYRQTHRHPPYSMQAFTHAKIFQNAIDAVPSLNLKEAGLDTIPPGSPAHFNQTTLLHALAPYAFLRSDTFTLHAAARSRDPLSGRIIGVVRCRAHAQRLPDEHPQAPFGRRFHISNFKWESCANE